MSRLTIRGEFDIAPGELVRFDGPGGLSAGFIEVFREHDLPLVDVLPGGPIADAYAMCVHPTFLKNRVWQHTDAWFDRLLGLGVKTIRGMFNPSNAGSKRVLELCGVNGVKWIATIIPEDGYDWTKDQVQARARAVADAIARWGVDIDVELMNEPDHRRSPSDPPVPDNWPAIMVRHAQWIREILPDVWIVSCSLHANVDNFERDWQRLGAAGLAPLINSIGVHDYDNGFEPCRLTDWRLVTARNALGVPNLPGDTTEYGHTISINNPTNERNPTSARAAALYAWRGHLDRVVTRNIRTACRFELLCDPDPERKITEAGFGVTDCPSFDPASWRDLPEAVAIRGDLVRLSETDPGFTPDPIRLRVDNGQTPLDQPVAWLVTQTSGQLPILWLWRPDTRVWDPEGRVDLTVDPVAVTVTTEHATRCVDVAGGMTTVQLTEIGPF